MNKRRLELKKSREQYKQHLKERFNSIVPLTETETNKLKTIRFE